MKPIVKAIIYDNSNKVLVLRRSGTHPYWPHSLDLPGGDIEQGEDARSALVREVAEETGLVVEDDLMLVDRKLVNGREQYIYTATLPQAEPSVAISWEHDQYMWLDAEDDAMRSAVIAEDPIWLSVRQVLHS